MKSIDQSLDKLVKFVEKHPDLKICFEKNWNSSDLDQLEKKYGLPLPPSYRYFIETYGRFWIERWGHREYMMTEPQFLKAAAPDLDEAAGGNDPEYMDDIQKAIDHALFFQYQRGDSVIDFFCFSTHDQREDGELFVIEFHHSDIFDNPEEPEGSDLSQMYTFNQHLNDLVQHIIEVHTQ